MKFILFYLINEIYFRKTKQEYSLGF